jgi:hypothetical protein
VNRCSVKVVFIQSTNAERAIGVVRLQVDSHWINTLRAFFKEHGPKVYRIIVEEWNEAGEGAFNLFHELRDRLAQVQEDESNENKEHLKKWLKETHGVTLNNGKLKSTTKYTVQEMSRLIDGTFQECYRAGADVRDLEPERSAVKLPNPPDDLRRE